MCIAVWILSPHSTAVGGGNPPESCLLTTIKNKWRRTNSRRGTNVSTSCCCSGTFFWLLKTASWRLTWILMMAETKADLSIDASNLHTSNNSGNASSQPNNPLSRKLNKILETRLDNDKVCNSLFARNL